MQPEIGSPRNDDWANAFSSMRELPSPGQRWTVRRKAAVIEAVRGGWVPIEAACRRYSISIDGFGAGPNQSLENPLGIGGPALHGWAFPTRTFQAHLFGNKDGETGIDDALLRSSSDNIALLGNGCLCCNVRSDLQVTLHRLVADRERGVVPHFQRVVIETSGLADPSPILTTFATDRALGGEFHVEAVITVIAAQRGVETIAAFAEARRQVILADAYRAAQKIKGEGDARASAIYADAYGRNAEFYAFYRSMQAYEAALQPNNTRLVLPPDSRFFRFFGGPSSAPRTK